MSARNSIKEVDLNLSPVDYKPLIREILTLLKKRVDLFTLNTNSLEVAIDTLALEIVQKLAPTKFQGYIPFVSSKNLTFSTAMFEDGEKLNEFGDDVNRIKDLLKDHLVKSLAQQRSNTTLASYLESFLRDISDFHSDTLDGLKYPLNNPLVLTRKHIHLRNKAAAGDRLRGHRLTITVKNLKQFDNELIEGLRNILEESSATCSQVQLDNVTQVLRRRITDKSSSLGRLKDVLWNESLGRLHKEASLVYLDYMVEMMKNNGIKDEEGLRLLRVLGKRLRMLDAFINRRDENGEEQGYGRYNVVYGGFGANYGDLLSQSEAYHVLPIIPEVEGTLGESYNKEDGEQIFISGMKFKLNGHVQTFDSAFDYYLEVLNPSSDLHKERLTQPNFNNRRFAELVLRVALIYFFVFGKMDDEEYDPSTQVDKLLLDILRRTDDQADNAREKQLRWLYTQLKQEKYKENLSLMRTLIVQFLKGSGNTFETTSQALHLSIDESIVDKNEHRMLTEKEFFWPDVVQEKGKNALKYMRIEDADAAGEALATLPIALTIEPIYYSSQSQERAQHFKMRYNLSYHRVFPVMLFPNTPTQKALCQDYYKDYGRVVFAYQPKLPFKSDSPSSFVYRFTYLLLHYLCLKMMLDEVKTTLPDNKYLFVPLIRIHTMPKAKKQGGQISQEDEHLHAMVETVAHVLGEEYLTNTQGFYIGVLNKQDQQWSNKLENGLASLYSTLPKAFTLDQPPALDKLAIIVVSSRRSDDHRDSSMHLSTIYGETLTLLRDTKGNIHVMMLSKFASNEDSDNMYQHPTAILNEAKKCYSKGYKHIFYIAQAPYSSKLHISSAQTHQEQFFMSKEIIQALKNNQDDLNIYPIYSDKYYVVKVEKPGEQVSARKAESMYIDDTSELRRLFSDPNQSSIVFFNLLNGFALDESTVYNGVVSYATLINVYDDPIYDQVIRNHLLDGTQPGSLKKDFVNFLTVFHFSRYEKNKNVNFKLDPYENIIGSASVGKTAIIPHISSSVRFNMLSFLSVVRGVVNRNYTGYLSTLFEEASLQDNAAHRSDAQE